MASRSAAASAARGAWSVLRAALGLITLDSNSSILRPLARSQSTPTSVDKQATNSIGRGWLVRLNSMEPCARARVPRALRRIKIIDSNGNSPRRLQLKLLTSTNADTRWPTNSSLVGRCPPLSSRPSGPHTQQCCLHAPRQGVAHSGRGAHAYQAREHHTITKLIPTGWI